MLADLFEPFFVFQHILFIVPIIYKVSEAILAQAILAQEPRQ